MGSTDDDTLRIIRPAASPPPLARLAVRGGLVLMVLGAAAAGLWTVFGPAPAPIATRQPFPSLTEAELLALRSPSPTMRRLRENPRVFVLLFPDLDRQGAALNRAAALIEKAGLPRDRLLDQAELDDVIARSGDTPATWYLGHDYRATDLKRFFALAARDRIALNEAELWVRDQLDLAEAEAGPGPLALVSAAAPGPAMDAGMRGAVLRHEIGHGHYFTIPGFAEHAHSVWNTRFAEPERAAFRAFLSREGYDPGNEDLLANETMAYLLFTPDPRFFAPAMVGLDAATVERLRGLLRDGLPSP